jgi:uncharacterized protein YndB with AHSA1/START domain
MSVIQINPCIVSERWTEVVEWAARVLDVPVACDSGGWALLHAATEGMLVLAPSRFAAASRPADGSVVLELQVRGVGPTVERARHAGARVVASPNKAADGTMRAAIETPHGVVLWLRDETAKVTKRSGVLNDGPLHFTVQRSFAVPPARVFEAITKKEDLEAFFVAKVEGDLAKDETATWSFEEDGAFPIHRIDVKVNEFLSFHWASFQGYDTRVQFAVRPADGGAELAITESGWNADARGQQGAFDNCEGWTTFLANLSLYLEHGIAPMRK